MLTPAQLRAARALLGIDQRTLADLAGVSLPTIQRMEASEGYVRGVVGTLTKVIAALEFAGVELISENAMSTSGGRGARLLDPTTPLHRIGSTRTGEARSARGKSGVPAQAKKASPRGKRSKDTRAAPKFDGEPS
jgi:transcriptional regulator with XRE-family HTH domain